MTFANIPRSMHNWRPGIPARIAMGLALALAGAIAAIGPERLIAQIEGERGITPIAGTTDIQIGGIEVNTTGRNAEEARAAGWKFAERKGWEILKGPKIADDQLESMVSAVVIEREQIGPRRYIARLGIIFDRQRAGHLLGTSAGSGPASTKSAPMLVIPLLYSGGAAQAFEVRGAWQRAWAQFQTGSSAIDYVRPSGAGGESLILTAGQPGRRSRIWWNNVLNQFGAADIIVPVARLERQWPGGPVRGTFTARYGPDNVYLDSFTLTANSEAALPAMLNQALVRLDRIYTGALAQGLLKPDPSLAAQDRAFDAALAALTAAVRPAQADGGAALVPGVTPAGPASQAPAQAQSATYVVQFASPDARAIDAALGSVRGVPGVQGASTSSIAIGGTSVMRVSMAGDLEALAAGLRARGWQVTVGSNALSIRR